MDTYDPERTARIVYNKRMYGAVYPPAIEAEIYAATLRRVTEKK
jgi:hypothetical protein